MLPKHFYVIFSSDNTMLQVQQENMRQLIESKTFPEADIQ